MPPRREHGWWPYWGPFFGFLLLVELGGRLPDSAQGAWLVLKVAAPGGLFLWFWRRGRYPELRGYGRRAGAVAADVGVGLLGAFLWVTPFLLFASLRPDAEGFDPQLFGPGREAWAVGVRFAGYALVTPFVEELFMRSWLLRFVDTDLFTSIPAVQRLADRERRFRDFRDVPIGHFSWLSFGVVTVFFLASHQPWEWPVMLVWTVGTMLWLYRRRSLMALVVVHAVTNAAILLFAVWGEGRFRDAAGEPLSLWFLV